MLLMRLKSLPPATAVLMAAFLVTMAVPGTAYAQTAPRVTFTPVAAPAPASTPALSQTAGGSYWTLIGGLEFDTDGMMYGFFGPTWNKPLRDDLELQVSVRPNFLKYEFEENGGTTKVSGPGLSTQVGLKFGDRNSFKVGAGPSFKWRGETFIDAAGGETELDSDMEVGFSVGADANLNPSDRDNVHAIVSYDTVDDYLWSRLAYKHQITNHSWQDT